jgi:hypothetical protein
VSDVHIRLAGPDASSQLGGLRSLIASRRGETAVVLHLRDNGHERIVSLAEDYRIRFDDDFRHGLRALGLQPDAVWTERSLSTG